MNAEGKLNAYFKDKRSAYNNRPVGITIKDMKISNYWCRAHIKCYLAPFYLFSLENDMYHNVIINWRGLLWSDIYSFANIRYAYVLRRVLDIAKLRAVFTPW